MKLRVSFLNINCFKFLFPVFDLILGEFFCTINDLKELSDLKVDNTIRKILTSLRHCKRIKEIRGNPPKLIRYAVIKSSVNAQNECI